MEVKIEPTWKKELQEEFKEPYFQALTEFIKNEYNTNTVYPPAKHIFAAFDHTPVNDVKVVILGQDPYHGKGQANGLCFSVNEGITLPPSLKNIFKEIHSDLGITIPKSGNLTRWADQGILLLNATLTVRENAPGSHQNKGWEQFTDAVIRILNEKNEHLVFLLWGSYAQKKGSIIDRNKHSVLTAPHPSPFSADKGFFGCKHFSKTNDYLISKGINQIIW